MKKIALFIILVLSLSLMLVSCGCAEHTDANYDEICDECGEATPIVAKYLGFEGIYNTKYDDSYKTAPLKTVTKIDEITNLNYEESEANLVAFEDFLPEEGENKFVVINTDTGKVVYSLKQEKTSGDDADKVIKTATLESVGEYAVIVEEATDYTDEYSSTYTTTIYSALGEKIDSKSVKMQTSFVNEVGENMFSFYGKIYTIENDVATFKCDLGFKDIPAYTYATDKYYYVFEYKYESYDNYAVYVYDMSFNYVTCYEAPSDADAAQMAILSDGNVMVQLTYELSEDATEYDFIADKIVEEEYHGSNGYYYKETVIKDVKYDLVTLVYNVETKTAIEYDVNYIIADLFCSETTEYFNEYFVEGKIVNYAEIYEIVDKKIDYDNTKYVSLSNGLKVIGYLGQEIEDQDGIAFLIADNRFIAYDKAGNTYLLNEKGEVLGNVTGAETEGDLIMGADGKIYDLNLTVKLDVTTIKYRPYQGEDDYAIFVDTYKDENGEVKKDYYLVDVATYTFKKLALTDDEAVTLDLYEEYYTYYTTVTENEEENNYIVYCNIEGTEIFRYCTDEQITETEDSYTSVEQSVYVTTYGGVIFFEVEIETYTYSDADGSDWNYETVYYIVK